MMDRRSFCDGVSRRDMLRFGAAGAFGFGLSLPQILANKARAAEQGKKTKDVSLIIVFLQGGLSTIDTWDMKPNAPSEFRGEFNPISTNVSGIKLCSHMPTVAKHADKFSLVNSFTHSNSGHGAADHWMLTGHPVKSGFNSGLNPNNQQPSHGSVIAKKLGPKGPVPPYVCLPKAHNSGGSAHLGSTAAPFVVEADPNAPNFTVPDLAPPVAVSARRLNNRKSLLNTINRFQNSAEVKANRGARTLNKFQEKAFALMTSKETKAAFNIKEEKDKLRDEYGRHSLGQSCLMARRLVEAGVRCVLIDHTNWDTHYNNFTVLKNDLLPHLDSAMAALLRDLEDRGMLDTTFVLFTGEFGRTPRVNRFAGRDHWGPSSAIAVAGGGVQGGRVIGASNARAERPATSPIGPEDLAATIYHSLGIDPQSEFLSPEGRPLPILPTKAKVIRGLF